MWARVRDGDHAWKLVRNALAPAYGMDMRYDKGGGVYPNLFDACPPFQIDGNFGVTAAIAEMLLQSEEGRIHLLPALPKAWESGSVKGLRARGGFEVCIDWKKGIWLRRRSNPFQASFASVKYGGKSIELKFKKGKSVNLDGELNVLGVLASHVELFADMCRLRTLMCTLRKMHRTAITQRTFNSPSRLTLLPFLNFNSIDFPPYFTLQNSPEMDFDRRRSQMPFFPIYADLKSTASTQSLDASAFPCLG